MSIKTREELHNNLLEICDNVYYNAPTVMKYPCILYELADISSSYANNEKYSRNESFKITYIAKTMGRDTEAIIDKLRALRYCEFSTHYQKDSLHHTVFQIKLE